MKSIAIVTRANEATNWGGDLKALYTIRDGLNDIGYQAITTPNINVACDSDFVFVSNTCLDLSKYHAPLKSSGKPFGLIAFHEDYKLYQGMSGWYPTYIRELINNNKLDSLKKPEYRTGGSASAGNRQLIESCDLVVLNSEHELGTMKRDYPKARGEVVYWTPGFADEWTDINTSSFCEKYNLTPGEYMLQVGRLETRKNTIGTILATQDMTMPLVLIGNKGGQGWYLDIVTECLRRRKGPTIIISDYIQSQTSERITVHNTQQQFGGKLPTELLKSAFTDAALNVHPAFYELPGYTYLEAAAVGTPSVGGEWCSIGEYGLGDLVKMCCSYDVDSIRQAIDFQLSNQPTTKPQDVPFLSRTKTDVAKDLIKLL
tara:strand:- start:645 stop:1763 length:1119 start_codon:yes stop_codon:yes gene_type:complete